MLAQPHHQPVRVDRRPAGLVGRGAPPGGACRRPVAAGKLRDRRLGALPAGGAAALGEQRDQRLQRLSHIGPHRERGRIVLAHLPVAQAELDDLQLRRQRLDLAVDRHLQHVRADADQHIVGRQQLAHAALVARQLAEEQRVLGREMGAAHHGLLIDRRAQRLGEARGLLERVAGDDLAAGEDHRSRRRQQPLGERVERRVGRAARGVDPGRRAELERALVR